VLFTTTPVAKIQQQEKGSTCNLFCSAAVSPLLIYERTIRNPAECSGVGLHSGAPVHLRILPAPAGAGIIFRRTDLDNFEVEAVCRNVAKVSYATSLMKKGVLISTTEHLLSAFIGMGIDNAIVELDNLELPILDGSAQPFIDMISDAGLRQQRRKRVYLKILRNGSYVHEIASARTFGFLHQQREMLNMGLIRGAARENCIVLTREGIDNPPLRYQDEFVRHKVLDLIGDLALFGKRILGYVKADRAGHAMHTAIVSRILRDPTYAEEVTLDEAAVADWPAEPLAVAD
jgi:UDP-3-O-[3-hydroxymyristoyl] N-acetylglucosamine deacetylase